MNRPDVEVLQVIRTRLAKRGDGLTDENPVRILTQYWSLEGELLAEIDPYMENGPGMSVEEFVRMRREEKTNEPRRS